MDALRTTTPTRAFWLRMRYRCQRIRDKSSCGYEVPFLLEDGCEGPRPPTLPARPHDWRTPSGRRIVPVPFIARRCPQCGEGDLLHWNWSQDERLNPPAIVEGEPENPYFAYPDDPTSETACGHPVFP